MKSGRLMITSTLICLHIGSAASGEAIPLVRRSASVAPPFIHRLPADVATPQFLQRTTGGRRHHAKKLQPLVWPAALSRLSAKPTQAEQEQQTKAPDASFEPISSTDAESPALRPFVILAVLTLVYLSNQWSRTLLYYLVDFNDSVSESLGPPTEAARRLINIDLGFDEKQYSFIASFGFTIFFSAAGFFAGGQVDKMSRRVATGLPALGWAAMTALQAGAQSFGQLFGLRVGQGVFMAFTTPAAYALLADIFPANQRATANSFYVSAVYLGQALASLSILLNEQLGWRAVTSIVAAFAATSGILSLLLVTDPRDATAGSQMARTIDEDKAGQGREEGERREVGVLGTWVDQRRVVGEVLSSDVVKLVILASVVRIAAGLSIGVWKGPLYRACFPDSMAAFSVLNAGIVGAVGAGSSLLGGALADRLAEKDESIRAWIPAVGSFLAAPLWMGVCLADSFELSAFLLLLEYLAAECWFGPTVAILQSNTPSQYRGTAQGLFQFSNLLSNTLPVLLGSLMTSFALKDVVAWGVAAAYMVSGGLFVALGQRIKAATAAPGGGRVDANITDATM
ncbi:unnamed protein product [Vitrella brassicaformis CCMP3155]|uniref:Major facilitator superfamily (MFS) profile domain-containing protein n=3 Tax=Vitrella brassicaformis TaxID=1169539 RepID=A0A0G4GFP1_VITBC|nr:unnamed protein product [Vitrella brassicaformis CCMP3155]|mmetsp:Transcript_21125/g.60362  ORF Transcript_21125/g.60362 Transcript_21125/m.60362 type:complete len:570 (+) Transcript_21125:64-1773(+)|eukprot:CEM28351.1 unnamed protein product [Vitrella brassicaformis CCMP3155]